MDQNEPTDQTVEPMILSGIQCKLAAQNVIVYFTAKLQNIVFRSILISYEIILQ